MFESYRNTNQYQITLVQHPKQLQWYVFAHLLSYPLFWSHFGIFPNSKYIFCRKVGMYCNIILKHNINWCFGRRPLNPSVCDIQRSPCLNFILYTARHATVAEKSPTKEEKKKESKSSNSGNYVKRKEPIIRPARLVQPARIQQKKKKEEKQ